MAESNGHLPLTRHSRRGFQRAGGGARLREDAGGLRRRGHLCRVGEEYPECRWEQAGRAPRFLSDQHRLVSQQVQPGQAQHHHRPEHAAGEGRHEAASRGQRRIRRQPDAPCVAEPGPGVRDAKRGAARPDLSRDADDGRGRAEDVLWRCELGYPGDGRPEYDLGLPGPNASEPIALFPPGRELQSAAGGGRHPRSPALPPADREGTTDRAIPVRVHDLLDGRRGAAVHGERNANAAARAIATKRRPHTTSFAARGMASGVRSPCSRTTSGPACAA